MPLNEREIEKDLSERQLADQVFDRWGSTRVFYDDWQDRYENLARIARNEFVMEWPDGKKEYVDPAIPNFVNITADDRASVIAATYPQVICLPEGPGDEAREKADKLERIVGGHLQMNRILSLTWDWAFDAMAGGLTVCKVLPDVTKPPNERYPRFTRLKPQLSYPEPVFGRGPDVKSFMYSYEEYRGAVESYYGVELPIVKGSDPQRRMAEKVRVIERYDDTWVQVVIKAQGHRDAPGELVRQWKHGLGMCPIAIGTRSNIHGTYAGEFDGGLGALETYHRLMTMMLDDAARKTYAEKLTYNVINPEDSGPDAQIELETPDARFEYVQHPNQPFSNLQILKDLQAGIRTSFLMPPSRSGDPNESIISAAGVNANQSQFNTAVQTDQRLVLGPMLEQAIAIGLKGEEVWSPNATKGVYGPKGGFRETYTPAKDIKGYSNVRIAYGPMGGMDPINQAVMMQQFHGQGGLSTRRMMELNPMIEDPQREEKQILREQLLQATIAGLSQRVVQGTLDPVYIAILTEAVQSDEVSLSEAVTALIPPAPPMAPGQGGGGMAPGMQPQASAQGPQAPGVPGAAEGPLPQNTVAGAA